MRKTRGYFVITDSETGKKTDGETWSCVHCQQSYDREPFRSPTDGALGRWCWHCDGPVCLKPGCATCMDFRHKLDLMEARDRLLRDMKGLPRAG